MINPFTTPIRAFFGVVGGVMALVAIFFTYRAIDSWNAGRRQAHLANAGVQGDSAKVDINSGALLAAKADTQYVPYAVYRDRPQTRADPVARELGRRADSVINTLRATVKADTSAIRHLQSQVKELQDAGPPPEPRLSPYGDIGYGATNRHRAVPVVRVGVDYRIFSRVSAKLEGSYEPPPSGFNQTELELLKKNGVDYSKPEFRALVSAHISFR